MERKLKKMLFSQQILASLTTLEILLFIVICTRYLKNTEIDSDQKVPKIVGNLKVRRVAK